MANEERIKKLIDVAKRRTGAIDVNSLNEIIINKNNLANNSIIRNHTRNRFDGKERIVKSIGAGLNSPNNKPRPNKDFLTKINGNFYKVSLPEKGAFNGAIIRYDENKIICVYRSDENNFVACFLDNSYNVLQDSFYRLKIKDCADPRLTWLKNNDLLLTYSSVTGVDHDREYVCGTIIMDGKLGCKFVDKPEFRISPSNLSGRQKNWMPFKHEEKLYFVVSVCPHEIYFLNEDLVCKKVYHTDWTSPWAIKEHHRGNTNAVMLSDGNYLATFHTSILHKSKHYYDNGSYIFSGVPPFNVMKCSNRTYLPAESACEPYFRKNGQIICNFPVGMMVENNKVIISYGDNDSVVKIVEYKIEDFLNTMIDV
jgi:predicted GH43/DUF377 family glycosyl hydrolase